MTHDPRTAPLRKWNELARTNTEDAIVSSMFEALGIAIQPIDKFSTWLLVGTAAVASFLITNVDKLAPIFSTNVFTWCGALLCISCFFGLLSKMFGLRAQIGKATSEAIKKTFAEHLEKYKKEEIEIQQGAKFWNIDLKTGIRIERLITNFFQPLPWWAKLMAKRLMNKYPKDPQVGYFILIKNINRQGYCALAQALSFLAFLILGFISAAVK